MTIGKRIGIWLGALVGGVGLANAVYWMVLLGLGALVCSDGCEEYPLAVAMLAGAAGLAALVVGPVLILRNARRWSNDT